MNKMIVIGAGALVLVGAAGGGAMLLLGGDEPVAAVPGDPAAALPDETFYYRMQPEFVVNLPQPSRDRFLMVELAVATSEEEHLELLEEHMPELRNDLLTLFGGRDGATLATVEGKRELRDAARDSVDALLARHDDPTPVKDVFLTRFVMQ